MVEQTSQSGSTQPILTEMFLLAKNLLANLVSIIYLAVNFMDVLTGIDIKKNGENSVSLSPKQMPFHIESSHCMLG